MELIYSTNKYSNFLKYIKFLNKGKEHSAFVINNNSKYEKYILKLSSYENKHIFSKLSYNTINFYYINKLWTIDKFNNIFKSDELVYINDKYEIDFISWYFTHKNYIKNFNFIKLPVIDKLFFTNNTYAIEIKFKTNIKDDFGNLKLSLKYPNQYNFLDIWDNNISKEEIKEIWLSMLKNDSKYLKLFYGLKHVKNDEKLLINQKVLLLINEISLYLYNSKILDSLNKIIKIFPYFSLKISEYNKLSHELNNQDFFTIIDIINNYLNQNKYNNFENFIKYNRKGFNTLKLDLVSFLISYTLRDISFLFKLSKEDKLEIKVIDFELKNFDKFYDIPASEQKLYN